MHSDLVNKATRWIQEDHLVWGGGGGGGGGVVGGWVGCFGGWFAGVQGERTRGEGRV